MTAPTTPAPDDNDGVTGDEIVPERRPAAPAPDEAPEAPEPDDTDDDTES